MNEENKRGRHKKEIGYNSVFATRLRKLMEENKTTQPQLAEAIGVSRQAVGQWKDGNTVPDILDFQKIADYYKVSADYLLGRTDNSLNIDEIKSMSVYKELCDEAICNIDTLFTMSHKIPTEKGFFISVPVVDVCNKFLSSNLFLELIKRLSELNVQSDLLANSFIFYREKNDVDDNLIIKRYTMIEFSELMDNENIEFFGEEQYSSETLEDNCDLARYRVSSIAEKINNLFDCRH